jgi:hypothetical protein
MPLARITQVSNSISRRKIEENVNIHETLGWSEQLAAYADGELTSTASSVVQNHLSECSLCQNELKAIQMLTANLARLPQLTVPRSFAITPEQARKLRKAPPIYTAARVALAMAAALLIFVCTLDFSGLVSSSADSPPIQGNVIAATPTVDVPLPSIGIRAGCGSTSSAGDVKCFNDPSSGVPYTAHPITVKPVAVPAVTVAETPASVHVLEIGLVALVLTLLILVLAAQPRAPTRLRL